MAGRTERRGRRQGATGRGHLVKIEGEIARLQRMPLGQLRQEWAERLGTPETPLRSREIVLRVLSWQIQAEAFGGLNSATEQKLAEIAATIDRDGTYLPSVKQGLAAGVVLTREWRGTIHTVVVTDDGVEHDGTLYRSLSDVARAITGTRWSGPRFFGLEQRQRARTRGAAVAVEVTP